MSTELINFQEEATTMPALLQEYGEKLIKAQAAVAAMPAIVDESSKEYAFALKNTIRDRKETLNGLRMPITRKLNEIIKLFTANENSFESLIATVDTKLNTYAKKELEKSREAQIKMEAELKKQQDEIDLKGRSKEYLRQRIDALLDNVRQGVGKLVSEVTAANISANKNRLSMPPKWLPAMLDFYLTPPTWIKDDKQLGYFKAVAFAEQDAHVAIYMEKAAHIMQETVNILDVAVNNKAEADRMQKAARDQAEAQALEKSQEAQARVDADKALASLDIEKPEAPKVRVKMLINVLSKKGWIQIVSFWFEHEKGTELDDFQKRTLKQMKTFAEASMNTYGTMINHPDVEYIEDVKAK